MNANFGIFLLAEDREKCFSTPLPPMRELAGAFVEVEGPMECSPTLMEGIGCKIYRPTDFIRKKLPGDLSSTDSEYLYMEGRAVDDYEQWLAEEFDADIVDNLQSHPFEEGLLRLLGSVRTWAVMFAPSGDRLEEFVSVDPNELISLVRNGVRFIGSSSGFLASKKTYREQ